MQELERELREAHLARERARAAAQAAARQAAAARAADSRRTSPTGSRRPTDEELGYYSTEDSFSKIVSDARSELSGLYSEAREHPVVRRVGELIDELASKIADPRSRRPPS